LGKRAAMDRLIDMERFMIPLQVLVKIPSWA
jgi:hypothetical protein